MAGDRRPRARIVGAARAARAAQDIGSAVRQARERRRLKQTTLAALAGISQARLAELEAGQGGGAPPEVWFALGEALGLYLKFEFGRDPQAPLRDAGHLDMQELLLRATKAAGWERAFETRSGGWASDRSVDVRLVDRKGRRLVIGECWNTFGDLGEATRSSTRKVRDAEQQAIAIAGDGAPYAVGVVWVVRDTAANRALIARYPHIFESRFAGSSHAWAKALTHGGPVPAQPGLIWCDVRSARLFARRRPR